MKSCTNPLSRPCWHPARPPILRTGDSIGCAKMAYERHGPHTQIAHTSAGQIKKTEQEWGRLWCATWTVTYGLWCMCSYRCLALLAIIPDAVGYRWLPVTKFRKRPEQQAHASIISTRVVCNEAWKHTWGNWWEMLFTARCQENGLSVKSLSRSPQQMKCVKQ